MKIHSVQYNFYKCFSRYFFLQATKVGMPATGLHAYKQQRAAFNVKMLNWIEVVDAKGEKLDQAETVTVLNDMCFIAPATLIDRRIDWEIIDDTTVKAKFSNGRISVSALLYFNKNGELRNFRSEDRYDTDGIRYDNYPWKTPVEDYRLKNGYMLPSREKLIYEKPEGDFTYGELEYKKVEYNLPDFED